MDTYSTCCESLGNGGSFELTDNHLSHLFNGRTGRYKLLKWRSILLYWICVGRGGREGERMEGGRERGGREVREGGTRKREGGGGK